MTPKSNPSTKNSQSHSTQCGTKLPSLLSNLLRAFGAGLLIALISLAIATYLSSCTHAPKYPRNALVDQILRFRTGFTGLTNRACGQYNEKNECTRYDVLNHDLEDGAVRRYLIELGFVCKVAGKRFKICREDAALCRMRREGLFGSSKKIEKVYVKTRHQFLIQASAKCFSTARYSFGDIQ